MDQSTEKDQGSYHGLHAVSVPGFEGPLDLLLSLIEEGKMDISEISLSAVTDQYLARLRSFNNFPPEHLADFLVVAATLLLLKSRTLFPDLKLTGEEEERILSLEEQLREYRKFRAAAKMLQQRWDENIRLWPRQGFAGFVVTFYPPQGMTPAYLRAALGSVLEHLPRFDVTPEEVLRRVVSIEERIRDIQERVATRAHTTFRELASTAASKVELIVSFLALLELVKQRVVSVRQEDSFRDIVIARPSPPSEAKAEAVGA